MSTEQDETQEYDDEMFKVERHDFESRLLQTLPLLIPGSFAEYGRQDIPDSLRRLANHLEEDNR